MINNCDIVKDLIPMYIEDLTSESSNQFIEKHLVSCKECTSYLKNMEKELPENNLTDIDENIDDKILMKNIKHKIYRVKFFAVIIGVLIGLGVSSIFFSLVLVGLVSFILFIVLLVYLLTNDEKTKI